MSAENIHNLLTTGRRLATAMSHESLVLRSLQKAHHDQDQAEEAMETYERTEKYLQNCLETSDETEIEAIVVALRDATADTEDASLAFENAIGAVGDAVNAIQAAEDETHAAALAYDAAEYQASIVANQLRVD
jgi:predicted RNA-binding Zn ribbon-like protein